MESNYSDKKLKELCSKVEAWHQYWKPNNARFDEYMNFVFNTSLTNTDKAALKSIDKPPLEFNIIESSLSRLTSDFAKQEPSLVVRSADGLPLQMITPEFVATEEMLEGHIRAILLPSKTDSMGRKIFRSTTGGGFGAVKILTEYVNEMSFEQKIKVGLVFDPTLTYFDPLAQESHKGDGQYCGELVPKTEEEFKLEFGEDITKDMKFSRSDNVGDFNWSYTAQNQKIVLVAEHFEKKIKKTKIVKLSNGHTVTLKQYKMLMELWSANVKIEQAPIVLEERWTDLVTICHYQFCSSRILKYKETNYTYLPIVFVDGNSVIIRNREGGDSYQMTRPYAYNAKGLQQLKNYCGETIAQEIENMPMHKWIVPLEAIPKDYQEAYTNPQTGNVLIYNTFTQNGERVDPPREVARIPTPPIIESMFYGADKAMQAIMGSYDMMPVTNSQQISGVAMREGNIQSNAAGSPYLESYIDALNRLGQIMLDLIPKYYTSARRIPVIGKDGKRRYEEINNPQNSESVKFDYDPSYFQVTIEAGVNSEIQKQQSLDQLIRLSAAIPEFGAIINAVGIPVIMDNMNIRGIDQLKLVTEEYIEKQKQAAEAQSQEPSPIEIEAQTLLQIETMKTEQKREEAAAKSATSAAEIAINQEKVDLEWAKLIAQVKKDELDLRLSQNRDDAEMARDAVDIAISIARLNNEKGE